MATVDPYSVVIGSESRSDYLSRKVNYYWALKNIVNDLPERSRVLSWGETRSYYFERKNITPTVFDYNPLIEWANSVNSSKEFAGYFKDEDITHIFVNKFELERLSMEAKLSPKGKEIWDDFKKYFTMLVFQNAQYKIYELNLE